MLFPIFGLLLVRVLGGAGENFTSGGGGPLEPPQIWGGWSLRKGAPRATRLFPQYKCLKACLQQFQGGMGGQCMFTGHNPPSPRSGRRKCRNVLPERCDSVRLFSENACLWCLALVAWGPFTWGGGGVVEIWNMHERHGKKRASPRSPLQGGRGLENGLQGPPVPPNKIFGSLVLNFGTLCGNPWVVL